MDRDNDIKEVIQEIDENISELMLQKEILQNLDFSKPVDEETWHKLCETPLRNSDLLGVLVKNIFPLAEDIKVHCNYVYFNLLGFKVQIPTSSCYSINIDTSWYRCSYWEEPKLVYDPVIDEITKYFEAVNNHKGWYECAKNRIRSGESYRKWFLFLIWFIFNKFLIETDAPYLTPKPYRGKQNETGYVRYVAEAIADLRGSSVEEVAKHTFENTMRAYGIRK